MLDGPVATADPDSRASTPRGRPPTVTHAEIASVALALFAERGFDETTVDEIAMATGISRRTLFRYFPSKNDVVWPGHGYDDVLESLRRCLASRPPDEPISIAVGAAIVDHTREHTFEHPAFRLRVRLTIAVPALQAHASPYYAAWRDVIAEYVAVRSGGQLTDLGPQTIAHAAFGAAMAALSHWCANPDDDLVENMRSAFSLFERSIG